MNITLKTKWLNTLLILTLMLGTLGITTAAAKCDPAKNDHCPVNAPGQQTNDDADDVVVINNGGQTLPDNAVANGVVKKEDDTVTVVNNGGQTLPDNAVANGVVNQMESAEDATTAPASPGVISASQGNQPAGADCSSLAGVVLTPPAETVTAQELHDLLQWDWKDGPTLVATGYGQPTSAFQTEETDNGITTCLNPRTQSMTSRRGRNCNDGQISTTPDNWSYSRHNASHVRKGSCIAASLFLSPAHSASGRKIYLCRGDIRKRLCSVLWSTVFFSPLWPHPLSSPATQRD